MALRPVFLYDDKMNTENKSPSYLILPILIIAIIAAFFWQTPHTTRPSAETNTALPKFDLPVLSSPNKRFNNHTLQGQVVLFTIWASWCGACREQHALLQNINSHYHVPIYGLNYKDDTADAEGYLKEAGNPYVLNGVDHNGDTSAAFSIYGTPETYLVDKHGMVRYHQMGTMDQTTWEKVIWPLVQKYQKEK